MKRWHRDRHERSPPVWEPGSLQGQRVPSPAQRGRSELGGEAEGGCCLTPAVTALEASSVLSTALVFIEMPQTKLQFFLIAVTWLYTETKPHDILFYFDGVQVEKQFCFSSEVWTVWFGGCISFHLLRWPNWKKKKSLIPLITVRTYFH